VLNSFSKIAIFIEASSARLINHGSNQKRLGGQPIYTFCEQTKKNKSADNSGRKFKAKK
jgi:hypothetical protein